MPAGFGTPVGSPPESGGGGGGTPQTEELADGPVSTRRIMLQRYVVLPARCQAALTAQVVYQRPTQPS